MKLTVRDRWVNGVNWGMVILGIGWIGYLGARFAALPTSTGSVRTPAAVSARPTVAPAAVQPVEQPPQVRPAEPSAPPAGAPAAPQPTATAPPARAIDPGAPHAVHPGVKQPAANPRTLPPGAGPDF